MLWRAIFAAAILIAAAPAASAHHSHAMYDPGGEIELTGAVVEYQWINPHVWLYLEVVSEAGTAELWVLETGSPTAIARRGWREDSLSPGDIATVTFRRLRDGSRGGLLGHVALPDGEVLYDPY